MIGKTRTKAGQREGFPRTTNRHRTALCSVTNECIVSTGISTVIRSSKRLVAAALGFAALAAGTAIATGTATAVVFESIESGSVRRAVASLPTRSRPRLVSLNWPNLAADCGVDQRVERIGEVAIETLAAMASRGEKGIPALASQTMIPGRWVEARG